MELGKAKLLRIGLNALNQAIHPVHGIAWTDGRQKQLSENVFIDERRPVLLCEGKLCLRAVQELFNLSIVEMSHGTVWIVLVADGEGFVPLTFKPKDEITVRDGRAKTVSLSSYSARMSQSESPHVAT